MAVKTRFMDGIASRLAAHHADRQHKSRSGIEVPYRRPSTIDLSAEINDGNDYGKVKLWRTVVMNSGQSNPAREFAPSSSAELWTLNGQTHNKRSDRHFGSKRVGLDALIGHLVVEVELDGLSADAKSMIITTGRHHRAKRALGDRLEEAIDRDLAGDTRLQELNREVREEAFRKVSQHRISGLDKALRAFNLLVKRPRTVRKPGKKGGASPPPRPKPLEPISPLHEHPAEVFQFRTVFRKAVHVQRGHCASVQLEADAVDGYFDEGNPTALSLQFVPDLGEKLRMVGLDSLEGGRMRIRFRAAKDAPLTETQLAASCLPPNASAPLSAVIPVEVVEAREPRKRPLGSTQRTHEEVEEDAPPTVVVAYEEARGEGHSWEQAGLSDWTHETVGQYKTGIAYINGDYVELTKVRDALPREQHADITNVYIAPLAMTLVGLAESETSAPKDEDGNDLVLHDHFRASALRSAALSALFAIRYMDTSGLLDLTPEDGEED